MKISRIINYLKDNSINTFEYYSKDIKMSKKYSEMYIDIIKAILYLREYDINKNERIGILCKNIYEYIVLDLACLIDGYVTVPFHTKDFENDINKLKTNYNLKLVFIGKEYEKFNIDKDVIILDDLIELIDIYKIDNFKCVPLENDSICTIIFTSGTTGFPKGIEVAISGIDDFLENIGERFTFKRNDKVIDFLPLSISNARFFVYGAILFQFNIVLTTSDLLMKSLSYSSPTIMQGVPYLFESIYNSMHTNIKESFQNYICFKIYLFVKSFLPYRLDNKLQKILFKKIYKFFGGKMRIMVTGSAPINVKVLKFFNDVGIKLYEAYGVNETGLISINSPSNYRIGSVGKPFLNKEVKILDNGEVLIKGKYCWGKEYINEDFKGQQKVFLENGYIATGDLGYLDNDGYLYISGRLKDTFVLTNGEKVHPNIIENKLKNSFLINQAVAIGDQKPFISCIIVKQNEQVTNTQLKKEISNINKNLPAYLHIKDFIVAEEPFTIKNKLMNLTLKLNRKLIYKKYFDKIESIYCQ